MFVLSGVFIASAQDKVMITGVVKDAVTNEHLVGAQIKVLDENDSIVMSRKAKSTLTMGYEKTVQAGFAVCLPRIDGDYRLEVSFPMYETEYVVLPMGEIPQNGYMKEIGDVLLYSKEIVPAE